MPATLAPPLPQLVGLAPRLWTRDEFYRMAELGFFDGQKAERLEGEIVVQSPQKWPHASTIERVFTSLKTVFATGFWVRMQFPLEFGLWSDPEPDVSVVLGRMADYTNHPRAAVLVVEVSDTTLWADRGRKLSLYAAARVPEYWIVNLPDDRLEVYRDPVPDPARPSGWGYATTQTFARGDAVPVAGGAIPVGDLLG